jgi:hypothetical protein
MRPGAFKGKGHAVPYDPLPAIIALALALAIAIDIIHVIPMFKKCVNK